MCCDCETELNRAYEFRERCINAQTYFSSADYKTHIDRAKKEIKFISKIDLEAALVKEEVMLYATEYETAELDRRLENVPNTVADADCEFLALKEDEIVHASYDERELESLDQTIEDTMHKLSQRNKTIKNIEVALKKTRKKKVKKHEPDENDQKKAYLSKKKTKGEGKSKERIYVCDQCGNQFKYRSHFYSHIKRHTGVKSVQCE